MNEQPEGASKKEACVKAGVAYSSFMRWQRQKLSLRRLVEEAERMCRDNQRVERDLEVLLSEKPTELKCSITSSQQETISGSKCPASQVDEADPMVAGSSGSYRHNHHAHCRGRCVRAVEDSRTG